MNCSIQKSTKKCFLCTVNSSLNQEHMIVYHQCKNNKTFLSSNLLLEVHDCNCKLVVFRFSKNVVYDCFYSQSSQQQQCSKKMHELQLCQLNHHSPAQSSDEHGSIFLGGPLNCIGYWSISIFIIIIMLMFCSFGHDLQSMTYIEQLSVLCQRLNFPIAK